MSHVEFRLTVSISDLEDEDGNDCAEICAICQVLGVTRLGQSLTEQYDSFYDQARAGHIGDPGARIGRGDVRVFQADADEQTFLSVDMFDEATDQMNTVELGVRCAEPHADRVATLLRSIRERVEVLSAFLQGNLGLRGKLDLASFPRQVNTGGDVALQHISVYRRGVLQATSRGAEQGAPRDRGGN